LRTTPSTPRSRALRARASHAADIVTDSTRIGFAALAENLPKSPTAESEDDAPSCG